MIAFLTNCYKAAHAAALHPNREWTYGWPLTGLEEPLAPPRPAYTPHEHAALAAFHRDRAVLEKALGVDEPTGRGGGGGQARGSGNDSRQVRGLKAEVEELKKKLAEKS